MKQLTNNRAFVAAVDYQDIIDAYVKSKLMHPDNPTEADLTRMRSFLPVKEIEMISLNWLRNKMVNLRKGGKLPKIEVDEQQDSKVDVNTPLMFSEEELLDSINMKDSK